MARYGKKMCRKGCGHPVGRGDCHADGFCPPKRGRRSGRGRHWMELSAINLKSIGVGTDATAGRGTAVAGVGGSKAGSHRQGKKQAKKAA